MLNISKTTQLRVVAIVELYPENNGWGHVKFYKNRLSYRIAGVGETKIQYVYAWCYTIGSHYMIDAINQAYLNHPTNDIEQMERMAGAIAKAHTMPILYSQNFTVGEQNYIMGNKHVKEYINPNISLNELMKKILGFDLLHDDPETEK
jgi:hypothetical protein